MDPVGGFRAVGYRMRFGGDVSSGFRFYMRVPEGRDGLEVALEWAGPAASRYEGSAAAATLEDLEGNPVAQARWVVPIGTVFDDSGHAWPGRVERLLLPVPPEHRGRVLRLNVFAPTKDLAWQVRGLEEPWLAVEPDAFGVD